MALVDALQDKVLVEAGSAEPLPPSKWDPESLKALTERYGKESKAFKSWQGMMGRVEGSTKPRATSLPPRPGAQSRGGCDLSHVQRRA